MVKLAHDVYIPPRLEAAIAELQKTASNDIAYLYNRAVGAGEFYGPNRNGDYFFDNDLPICHESFVKNAHWFRHHINKNPEIAIGRPYASAYNDKMHSVDLILAAPVEKVAYELGRLEQGDMILTSMGARVPYDVCSICNHKSTSEAQYCDDLKFHMRELKDDGKIVCAYNPKPKFFDISTVVVPAGDESAIFMKVAAKRLFVVPSAVVAKQEGVKFSDKMASEKIAEIEKNIPGELARPETVSINRRIDRSLLALEQYEDRFPRAVLDRLSDGPMRDVFGSTKALGIVLSPSEFQYIVLRKVGKPATACRLREAGITFERPSVEEVASLRGEPAHGTINDDMIEVLSQYMPERSGFSPFLQERLLNLHRGHVKVAQRINDDRSQDLDAMSVAGTLAGLAGLYALYRYKYPSDFSTQSRFIEFIKRNPYLSSFLAAGSLWKLHDAWNQERGISKLATASPATRLLGPAAGTYLGAGYLKHKLDSGELDPDTLKGKAAQKIVENPGKLALVAGGAALFGKKLPKGLLSKLKQYKLTKVAGSKTLGTEIASGKKLSKEELKKNKKKGLIPLSTFRSGVEGTIFPITMGTKRLATRIPVGAAEMIGFNKLVGGDD